MGDVAFNRKISTGGQILQLNGAGIRNLWFLDLFAVGLYVDTLNSNANQIIESERPQALRIVIMSNLVTISKFKDGIDDIIRKRLKDDVRLIENDLALFKSLLGGEMKPGSEIYAVYEPSKGLKVFRDGKYTGIVPGNTFKKETLQLWIGELCVSDDLRDELLGID